MAYLFETSYYLRPYRGKSGYWLNRCGEGRITARQTATLYTATGQADQRLQVHRVSGGCRLLSDLDHGYGLAIRGVGAGSVCEFYPVRGSAGSTLLDLMTVDAAQNLYRVRLIGQELYLTPAADAQNAALRWQKPTGADDQVWQLCTSQDGGGTAAICMPVNVNQNYRKNSGWIRQYGCALCCGVDIASWKRGKPYTLADFAGYYQQNQNGYSWTGPEGFAFGGAVSLAKASEAATIETIRRYVRAGVPVACHAVGAGGRQHWFVACRLTGENGATWATAGIGVLDPYNGNSTSRSGRETSILDAMRQSRVTLGIDRIRVPR